MTTQAPARLADLPQPLREQHVLHYILNVVLGFPATAVRPILRALSDGRTVVSLGLQTPPVDGVLFFDMGILNMHAEAVLELFNSANALRNGGTTEEEWTALVAASEIYKELPNIMGAFRNLGIVPPRLMSEHATLFGGTLAPTPGDPHSIN